MTLTPRTLPITWGRIAARAIEAGCWLLGILTIVLAAALIIKFIMLVVGTW